MKIYTCDERPQYDGEHNYQTVAIFSKKKVAERFAKKTDTQVSEWDLDKWHEAAMSRDQIFIVNMYKDGRYRIQKQKWFNPYEIGFVKFLDNKSNFTYNIFAENNEYAIKKANIKRIELLTSGEWPRQMDRHGVEFKDQPLTKEETESLLSNPLVDISDQNSGMDIPLRNDLLSIVPSDILKSPFKTFNYLFGEEDSNPDDTIPLDHVPVQE